MFYEDNDDDIGHIGKHSDVEKDREKEAKMAAITQMKDHIGVSDDDEGDDPEELRSNSELQSPGYSMKYKKKDKKGGGGGMDMGSIMGMMG